MDKSPVEIGLIIQELADKLRLQRKDLAECLGVTTNNIQKQYERQMLSVDKMEKLSILTGINLFDLYSTQEPLRALNGEAKWLRRIIQRLQKRLAENAEEIERLKAELGEVKESRFIYKTVIKKYIGEEELEENKDEKK
ncbi:hypothetical protein [Filimonas effusa]|uniref:Uncharacterized protein n=1 Tax=Filimonas effusa TaxID=2508721 RepID=A0A4V1MAW8_9BACT|nr:hypothetical protein [Filimonas effusa]RXK87326.1 hypothetical protein ESB13_11270 [Filimonas effusa]